MPMMVPRLLMKASPGPVVRKKPLARNHIVGSVRKMRVSTLSRRVFLNLESESGKSWGLLSRIELVERAGGDKVP